MKTKEEIIERYKKHPCHDGILAILFISVATVIIVMTIISISFIVYSITTDNICAIFSNPTYYIKQILLWCLIVCACTLFYLYINLFCSFIVVCLQLGVRTFIELESGGIKNEN